MSYDIEVLEPVPMPCNFRFDHNTVKLCVLE
jgi:hypothetical protein